MAKPGVTVEQVVDQLSTSGSTWTRADVLRAICDLQPAVSSMSGHRWAAALERAADQVIDHCIDLDPPDERTGRRTSDGRETGIAADTVVKRVVADRRPLVLVAGGARHLRASRRRSPIDVGRRDLRARRPPATAWSSAASTERGEARVSGLPRILPRNGATFGNTSQHRLDAAPAVRRQNSTSRHEPARSGSDS
jgi:hypothetical protein